MDQTSPVPGEVPTEIGVLLEDDADRDEIRTWLSGSSQEVPSELGIADGVEAAASGGISLERVENPILPMSLK